MPDACNFSRKFSQNITPCPLWDKLLKNCGTGKVFPAIRNNQIDFYYQGGKLFSYNNRGFSTHQKYAAAIGDFYANYLTESEMQKSSLISSYDQGYDRIKENCKNYSGLEALGVSALYHKNSYVKEDSRVVVLDIEVSFGSKDRVDILLYDLDERELMFVEAKHYSNSELWAKPGHTPPVVYQIERYNDIIDKHQQEIIDAYQNYIKIVNTMFKLNIEEPVGITQKTKLYIFGFDDDQKKGRLQNNILNNSEFAGISIYAKGNSKSVTADTLWKVNHNK